MEYPFPGLNHRDDVEPSSAAGVVERTYDSAHRPSRRLRAQAAPLADPLADDPGSLPHASADEVMSEGPGRLVEDYEGMQSRKGGGRRTPDLRARARKAVKRHVTPRK